MILHRHVLRFSENRLTTLGYMSEKERRRDRGKEKVVQSKMDARYVFIEAVGCNSDFHG